MTLSEATKQRIIDLAKSKNITLHKFAQMSGLQYSTLSSFMNGKCESITLTTLLHICEGAGISVKDFFDDPLFKNVEYSEPVDVKKK